MEYLGGINLFTFHFIIGTLLPERGCIELTGTLQNWIEFKDNDLFMHNYRTDRTQYISFIEIIELHELELIINDLAKIYKSKFPYAQKEDFINHVFGYTIFDLERFIEKRFVQYSVPTEITNQDVFYTYSKLDLEFLDYFVERGKSIEFYKQYFKRVIKLINEFSFEILEDSINEVSPVKYEANLFSYDKEIQELKEAENEFHKPLPMSLVIDHLEFLISESKNGKPYLTKEQFVSYLKRAFLNDRTQPIQKLNFGPREKGKVIKKFYGVYSLARDYEFEYPKHRFIEQFLDCFSNITRSQLTSSFK